MKILIAHNFYQQPGGEDQCFRAESALLEAHGHEVIQFTRHNDSVKSLSAIALARTTLWNHEIHREFRALLQRVNPDIVHCHNTFPLLSPAIYHAAYAEGIPVIQTLHNYRLLCPNALLFRDGHVCEQCIGKTIKWPGVVHACYRASRPASAVTASMLLFHRILKTWTEKVTLYIALTEFSRQKLTESGLPAHKIVVKPNFIKDDPDTGNQRDNSMIFLGRLSPEKGMTTLLSAWKTLSNSTTLKIIGDGPLSDVVKAEATTNKNVDWLGRLPHQAIYDLLKSSMALIFPSLWFEGMPRVIIEAFATGTPVIASRLGATAELIQDGKTGLHFNPGDPADLAKKVTWAYTHPQEMAAMGRAARAEFEAKYTAERNYEQLIAIYERAMSAFES